MMMMVMIKNSAGGVEHVGGEANLSGQIPRSTQTALCK